MGEEVNMSKYNGGNHDEGGCRNDDRVSEWELGLPNADDLTPLSQPLISPELASAFIISPEPRRSMIDVNRASQNTLSSIRGEFSSSKSVNFKTFNEERGKDGMVVEGEESDPDLVGDGSNSRKVRRIESCTEESEFRAENGNEDGLARTASKRARLVWTPQLHKRFIEVVAHLGIKNAVPKTIMQMMNVEGLTRENVASHLQKYRLYLKRMQGGLNEDPSSSDPLFTSTPVPQSLHESGGRGSGHGHRQEHGHGNVHGHGHGHMPMPIPMPYPRQMMHMPVMGMGHGPYQGYDSSLYNVMQQRDWSGGKFGSVAACQHVAPNDK